MCHPRLFPLVIAAALTVSPDQVHALGLELIDPGYGSGAAQLLTSRGIAQPRNFKSALKKPSEFSGITADVAGQPDFWKTSRAWQLAYDHAVRAYTWSIFSGKDWIGSEVMVLKRSDIASGPGRGLVGLRIDVRTKRDPSFVSVSNVSFNGQTVNTMSIVSANPMTEANGIMHWLDGPVDSFTLRGRAFMGWNGLHSSDSISFDIRGFDAAPVPENRSLVIFAVGAALLASVRAHQRARP